MSNRNQYTAAMVSRATGVAGGERYWQRRVTTTWTIVMLLCLSSAAIPQDGRLNVDLAASSPRVRPNAPVMLLMNAFWNGSSIIDGRFEVRYFHDGRELRSETVSHEVVLTPGQQTIRLTLPTSGSIVSFGQDVITLKFVAETETFDLGRYTLPSGGAARSVNVCVIGPTDRAATTMAESEITDSMRLDDALAMRTQPGSSTTVYTRWDNADVPEQPLHFCNFDVVLLRPDGLAELRQKQLDALLAWVRAGGSVGVLLSGDVSGRHVDFLNTLVRESVKNPFVLNTNGVLVADATTASNGIWLAHTELGRVAILDAQEMSEDSESLWKQTRNAAGFLWKVRQDLSRSTQFMTKSQIEQRRQLATRRNRSLDWQPLPSVGQFVSELMPDDVRVVPTGLIGLILLGYLVLIGPVDYFLLGYFRRRRYTWITFPAITVGITFCCVWTSEYHLSSTTSGDSLIIRDVGADGVVLRESRFDLKFLSRRREITTEVQNAIFTPLDSDRLMLDSQYALQRQFMGQGVESKQVQFQGRIPEKFEVKQVISQWKPEVNRTFRIAPDCPKVDGFDWNNTELLEMGQESRLSDAVLAVWPGASAILYRQSPHDLSGSKIFRSSNVFDGDHRRPRPYYGGRRNEQPFTHGLVERPRTGAGLFELVSQVSPTGGDNFEDLALLDGTDPNQAVLLIAIREGNTLVIYRRLYTGLNKVNER